MTRVETEQVNPIAPLVKTAPSRQIARAVKGVLNEKTVTSAQVVSNDLNATTAVIVSNAPVMTNEARGAIARAANSATIGLRATTAHAAMTTLVVVTTLVETTVLHGASPSVKRAAEGRVLAESALTAAAQEAVPVVTPEHAAARPLAAKAEVSQAPATTEKMSFKSATRAQASVRKHITQTALAS